MRANMDESDLEDFDNFVERYWGKQNKPETVSVGADDSVKRRGRKPKNEI